MFRAVSNKGKGARSFCALRDAIKLMVDVLFSADDDYQAGSNTLRSTCDLNAVSCVVLLVAQDALNELNTDVKSL